MENFKGMPDKETNIIYPVYLASTTINSWPVLLYYIPSYFFSITRCFINKSQNHVVSSVNILVLCFLYFPVAFSSFNKSFKNNNKNISVYELVYTLTWEELINVLLFNEIEKLQISQLHSKRPKQKINSIGEGNKIK